MVYRLVPFSRSLRLQGLERPLYRQWDGIERLLCMDREIRCAEHGNRCTNRGVHYFGVAELQR